MVWFGSGLDIRSAFASLEKRLNFLALSLNPLSGKARRTAMSWTGSTASRAAFSLPLLQFRSIPHSEHHAAIGGIANAVRGGQNSDYAKEPDHDRLS